MRVAATWVLPAFLVIGFLSVSGCGDAAESPDVEVDPSFRSFTQYYAGAFCTDECVAFHELRSDGTLSVKESGGPIREAQLAEQDLAEAVEILTDPALEDFFFDDPLARCGVVDSVEFTELRFVDGPRAGVTTLCDDPPLQSAREKLWELSAAYLGADVFGRPIGEL